jgi:tRNA nucleotidyltransferase (CCA-adding enzyme)
MADYIYLLENRLSPAQRSALRSVRELARSKNLTVFLVGGAVRDLTSGSPVRDLDVVVQGNALKLKRDLEKAGAIITGELAACQSLFAAFPGSVRMEISSTLSVSWPKPGKPVYKPATILEDLRRRDFTANAMALSLNEGSYGLLMDPLNGIADIENRELRLVSNYGFIEDPVRMVRASRLMARLGWALDEKTRSRYETGKQENYIAALSEQQRGYELEEIVHEEDPLRVITRLEAEGWLAILAPYWTAAKADVPALEHLREVQTQLQMQGIHPDPASANFPLLTARLNAKDVAALKASFVRPGFVKEIESLEQQAKELTSVLNGKAATLPSQTWQILTSASPEAVLWVAYSSKTPAIQTKFKNFFTVWPLARQKMPYVLMQEMRIVPELPIYEELLGKLFFELMDERLQTPEELKAFLEPYSPPAPPPPVSTRRPRAAKKDAKGKGRAKKVIAVDLDDDEEGDGELPDEIEEVLSEALDEAETADSADDVPRADLDDAAADADEADEADDEPAPAKPVAKVSAKVPMATVKAEAKSKDVAPLRVVSKPATNGVPLEKPVTLKPAAKASPTKAPATKASATKAPATNAPTTKASANKIVSVKGSAGKPDPGVKVAAKAVNAKPVAARTVTPPKQSKATVAAPASRRTAVPAKAVKSVAPAKVAVKKAPAKVAAKPPIKAAGRPAPAAKPAMKKPTPPVKIVVAKKVVAKKVVAKKSVPTKTVASKAVARKQSPPTKTASKHAVAAKKRR